MFNKKRKRNPLIFTASMIGAGAAAYYLTKEATQGEDRVNEVNHTQVDKLLDVYLGDGSGINGQ
jgi:hypothetical protein